MKYDSKQGISAISYIHTKTSDFLSEKLAEQGLSDFSSSHGNILYRLSQNDFMTMSELCAEVNRDKSTLTVLIRKLEKEGLVKIESDKNDARVRKVSLTQKGKKYNEVTGEISRNLQKKFYSGFTESEKEKLTEFLNKIISNFQE